MNFYQKYIKRALDFILALLIFILGLPFLLLACLAIKLDSAGPCFFSQERIGYLNQKFTVYKLRTMILQSHDKNGEKIRDRDRITKVGRIVRKLSIDELPQLLNVIKGDMSLIGPRPLPIRYFPYYSEEEIKRHNVLPGITGLAQVNGRSNLAWEKRFAYDVQYAENVSFLLDVQIIFKTIMNVVKGKDTSTIRPESLVDFDRHRNFEKQRELDC